MAFAYQPFLIANLAYGLELGLQPWLLPQDAFAELQNAYLSRGVLYKRQGYEAFGRLVHQAIDEVVGNGGGIQRTFYGTLGNFPVRPGETEFSDPGVETLIDPTGSGVLTGTEGGTGTINYATGVYHVVFGDPPAGDVLATYHWFPGLPCMGMWNYTGSSGDQDLLAFTTKRVNRFNVASQWFEDISGADTFTGDDNEFFWVANWLNRGFLTNGKDQLQIYDGATVAPLVIDLDVPADGVNNVNSVSLVFPFKDRLVLLRTVEDGATYAQRARWSPVGKYTDWEPTDYVDAPTHEWIMGAAWIRNDLIVWFERSIWALRYTGDVRLPLRWVRIAPNEGLTSKMALADFSDEILGMGPTRLVGTDGIETYNVDDRVPNMILSMNQAKLDYCFAAVLDERSQMWVSYPSLASDFPDKALVLNYDEKSFSIFTLPMFAFGYFDNQADLTWDDIDLTWNEIEWAWDERSMQAGYPILLGADYQGYVWKMNTGSSDNGAAIEMAARSGRMNPFVKQGKEARLGWVDFLVDRDPGIELTVEYRINHESAAWTSDVFTCDDGSSDEKIWVRSYVGCEAEFHQLRIYNNQAGQTPVIHAVMPWFCPGGGIS
jgi:hypothetical protein